VKIIREIQSTQSFSARLRGPWLELPDYVPDPAHNAVEFDFGPWFNISNIDKVIQEWKPKGLVTVYNVCEVYREPHSASDYAFRTESRLFAAFDNATSAVMFKMQITG
jgi:hypothetical protein